MSQPASPKSQATDISDISSFAAWELLHPANLAEEDSREVNVSMGGMARPERVWKDRDSNNDARSLSEQEEEHDIPLVNGKTKRETVNGGISLIGKMEIPSSTAGMGSQGRSQDLGLDYDAPPSSQPRPEGEDEEEKSISQVNSHDFAIDWEDEDDDSRLKYVFDSVQNDLMGNGSQDETQKFAREHPLWEKNEMTEEELSEFEADVEEFAKIAGLGPARALAEAKRARSAWKAARGKRNIGNEDVHPTGQEAASSLTEEDRLQIYKRQRKQAKKARRQAERKLKAGTRKSTEPKIRKQKQAGRPNLQSSSAIYSDGRALDGDMDGRPSAVANSQVLGKNKPKKKKVKKGPTTSTYFAKLTTPAKSTWMASKIRYIVKELPEEVKEMMQKAQEAVKEAAPLVENAVQENAKLSKPNRKNQEGTDQDPTTENLEKKKKKRKRERNRNRLAEDEAKSGVPKASQAPQSAAEPISQDPAQVIPTNSLASGENTKTKEPGSKKRRDRGRKSTGNHAVEQAAAEEVVRPAAPIESNAPENILDVPDNVPHVPDTAPDALEAEEPARKKRRRDRGRKSERKQQEDMEMEQIDVPVISAPSKADVIPKTNIGERQGSEIAPTTSNSQPLAYAEKPRHMKIFKKILQGDSQAVVEDSQATAPASKRTEPFTDRVESKKSKKKNRHSQEKQSQSQSQEAANDPVGETADGEALNELPDTNSEKAKNRFRGVGKTHPLVDDQESMSGEALLDSIENANDEVEYDHVSDEIEGLGSESEQDILPDALSEGMNEATPNNTDEDSYDENDPADWNYHLGHTDDVILDSETAPPTPITETKTNIDTDLTTWNSAHDTNASPAPVDLDMPLEFPVEVDDSVSSYGSPDRDDSANELASVEVDASLQSGGSTMLSIELPAYRPTMISASPDQTVKKRTFSCVLVRDNNGRFAPKDATASKGSKSKRRKSTGALTSSAKKAISQERDSHGRFAPPKDQAPGETPSAIFKSKRVRSTSASPARKSISQERDSRGRFGRKDHAAEEATSSVPKPKPLRISISAPSARNATSQEHDPHGRFAPNDPAPEATPSTVSKSKRVRTSMSTPSATSGAPPAPSARSAKAMSQERDAHGRFAPKESASREAASSVSKKRARSSSASAPAAKKVMSQERDTHGRFGAKIASSLPTENFGSKKKKRLLWKRDLDYLSTPEQAVQSASLSKSSQPSRPRAPLKRDSSGRFAPARDSSMSPLPPELESQLLQRHNIQQNEPVIEVAPREEKRSKRQPAKSPFFQIQTTPSKAQKGKAAKENAESSTTKPKQNPQLKVVEAQTPEKSSDDISSQGSEKKRISRAPGKTVSCIPFPPLSAPHFGLIQEKLAHNPFRLLIAVTFLIRTHGKHAIPVFFELMEKYPTPEALAAADKEDVVHIIRHLGLQNQRAETSKTYAKIWLENPPTRGKRYPVRGYPDAYSGRDLKRGEPIPDEDERHAWEIGHMTSGPYAMDSWRIFCRDKLRGVADGWNGEGSEEGFQPEWMRVVPEDKELRAYLRWMWLKEGFQWDPFTGDKEVASPRLMKAAMEGRIAWDDQGGMRIIDEE